MVGAKIMQNLVVFWTSSNNDANISEMYRKTKNHQKIFFTAIPPAFGDKSPVNFGPLTKSFGCEFGHTQVDFFENHILALTVL